jgi:anti-sigma factor RsiW
MKCNKIKILIHDYVDGELDDNRRKTVEEHLKSCTECKKFEETVRGAAVAPFEKSVRVEPSPEVWNSIKGAIAEESERKGFLQTIKESFEAFFGERKVAFAALSTVVIIVCFLILANIYMKREDPVNTFLNDQMNFLVALEMNGESENGFTDIDFGTDIEKYLL